MRKAEHAQIEILTYVIYIANLNLHDKREAHSLRSLANYKYSENSDNSTDKGGSRSPIIPCGIDIVRYNIYVYIMPV